MVRFKGYFLGLLFKCIYRLLCEGKWVFSVIRFGVLVSLILHISGIFLDYRKVSHFMRCIVKCISYIIGVFLFYDS